MNEVPALSVFDAEDRVVTFSSDDPKVIEATPDGKLTVKGKELLKLLQQQQKVIIIQKRALLMKLQLIKTQSKIQSHLQTLNGM